MPPTTAAVPRAIPSHPVLVIPESLFSTLRSAAETEASQLGKTLWPAKLSVFECFGRTENNSTGETRYCFPWIADVHDSCGPALT
jgi:hypothetical protein